MNVKISYDYTQKVLNEWRTYNGNLVGRYNGKPIGYGPVGPGAIFNIEEVPLVLKVLCEQLATSNVTLHIQPHYEY